MQSNVQNLYVGSIRIRLNMIMNDWCESVMNDNQWANDFNRGWKIKPLQFLINNSNFFPIISQNRLFELLHRTFRPSVVDLEPDQPHPTLSLLEKPFLPTKLLKHCLFSNHSSIFSRILNTYRSHYFRPSKQNKKFSFSGQLKTSVTGSNAAWTDFSAYFDSSEIFASWRRTEKIKFVRNTLHLPASLAQWCNFCVLISTEKVRVEANMNIIIVLIRIN